VSNSHGQAQRLVDAIVAMADRYGKAEAAYGEAFVSYSHAVPEPITEACDRRIAAVRRLAEALANLRGAS
jgi:hypothetical protein